MLSESTMRLVENAAVLGEPQTVHIKGSDDPLSARRLLGVEPRHGIVGRLESSLVGRRWEMGAVEAILDRALDGRGGVVGVVGSPGIGKLDGHRGAYVCRSNVADMRVPATLQATIAARIDRLDAGAKRTLNGAAVIGSRFDTDLLNRIDINPVLDELITSELIDHVRFAPRDEYAFHHPLIRSVAYESQLKSDRAQLHLRLAASLEEGDPESADLNSAVIAEHLEAGGDLRSAYSWHMRAGTSATNHDIAAAHVSWTRARRVADSLPEDDPNRIEMRIAPRTLMCASAWRVLERYRTLATTLGFEGHIAMAEEMTTDGG